MLYLLAGHTIIAGKGTGAFGINGFDEAIEAARLRDDITKLLRSKNVAVINDVDTTPLQKVVMWLKSLVKKNDKVIEMHFNAGPPTATGVEVYIDDTPTGEEVVFARQIATAISRVLGIKLRGNAGVRHESESQHSSLAIISVPSAAVNVLVEVCFLTNNGDVDSYRRNYNLLVEALAEIIQ
ncbi:N-acetylmuramoyl-L-alanine amidase [Runella sp.]|uniref:N-acetylmuramoyl-L-alanine amidase n=1 Tax=Runella sp. TaxID=1960881 RepID=UPI003D139736